jgi:hypothetical protein
MYIDRMDDQKAALDISLLKYYVLIFLLSTLTIMGNSFSNLTFWQFISRIGHHYKYDDINGIVLSYNKMGASH